MENDREAYSRDLPRRTVWFRSALTVLVIGPCGLHALMGSLYIFLWIWPVSLAALWMVACAGRALWVKEPEWHVHFGLAVAFVLLSYWLVQALPGMSDILAKEISTIESRRLFMAYLGVSGWLLVFSLMIRHRFGWPQRSEAKE